MNNFEGVTDTAKWLEDKIIDSLARVVVHDSRPYVFNRGKLEPILMPSFPTVELTTLTGLIDYVKAMNLVEEYEQNLIIQVVSPSDVRMISKDFGPFRQRDLVLKVSALLPRISLNAFVDQESFIIQAQSCFVPNTSMDTVLQVVGNMRTENVKDTCDDGVTQVVSARAGVARLSDVPVPRQVSLAPIRTFPEVTQPESAFVLRIQDGPRMALFEADGGAWRNRAMIQIKEWIEKELGEHHIAVIA